MVILVAKVDKRVISLLPDVVSTLVEQAKAGKLQPDTAQTLLDAMNDHEQLLDKHVGVAKEFESKIVPLLSSNEDVRRHMAQSVDQGVAVHNNAIFVQRYLVMWIHNLGFHMHKQDIAKLAHVVESAE